MILVNVTGSHVIVFWSLFRLMWLVNGSYALVTFYQSVLRGLEVCHASQCRGFTLRAEVSSLSMACDRAHRVHIQLTIIPDSEL